MRPVPIIQDAIPAALIKDADYALSLEYVAEALLWAIDAPPPLSPTSIGRFLGQSNDEPDDTIPAPVVPPEPPADFDPTPLRTA